MFSRAICEYKYGSAEGAPLYGSFDDALREITRLSERERLVLVIDEYPYAVVGNGPKGEAGDSD